MSEIIINPYNETFIRIDCDPSILQDLSDYFTISIPNPQFLRKKWNGKIRLLDKRKMQIYRGLIPYIQDWAKSKNLIVTFSDPKLSEETSIYQKEVEQFAKSLIIHNSGNQIEPYDHQILSVTQALRKKRTLIVSPTACHPKGQKILTYNGSLINVEDVKIGDELMGPDNLPRIVLKSYNGHDDIYKITPFRSNEFYCNANHILHLVQSGTNKIINITLKEYLQKSNWFKHTHYLISNSKEIEFPNSIPYNGILTPYFIGAYLGDGHVDNCAITTMDEELVEEIYKQINKIPNAKIRIVNNKKSKANSYHINGFGGSFHPIFTEFHSLGLHFGTSKKYQKTNCGNKFIPEILKIGTIEDRYELLAGLIDTNGYKSKNDTYYSICSKSKKLIEDAGFLAKSLGFAVSIKILTKKIKSLNFKGNYYSCSIMGNIEKIPVRIKRKKVTLFPDVLRNKHHHLFNIEYVEKQEYFGFELDKDHLYFTDNYIVNHNSGKSLVIYLLCRSLVNKKILIIVPTTNLVEQLFSDFEDYSVLNKWKVYKHVHRIYQGHEKISDKQIYISTWQSLQNLPKEYFEQFECVIGDEAHGCSANSLKTIIGNCTNAKYRIGLTGTIQNTKCHVLVIEGLFGCIYRPTTTKKLIDERKLSPFEIKCVVLNHPKQYIMDYHEEINYLVSNVNRNKYICNLAMNLKNNTLILYQFVEKHGLILKSMLDKLCGNKKNIYFISGMVDAEIREQIRKIAEKENNCIIVASYGTFSFGANIKNLHNIIFASPSKGRIRIMQSIGRELRLHPLKNTAYLFDISDNLNYTSKRNYSLTHLIERIKLYDEEKFNYKFFNVDLKG